MQIYIGNYRPLITRQQNRLEIFNEMIVMMSTYTMFCYTDHNPNLNWQYRVGWFSVGLVCLSIAVNVCLMFLVITRNSYLVLVKVKRLLYHKINKRKDRSIETL
jgi:hypothetical protein